MIHYQMWIKMRFFETREAVRPVEEFGDASETAAAAW
jgi:hypothetical protein